MVLAAWVTRSLLDRPRLEGDGIGIPRRRVLERFGRLDHDDLHVVEDRVTRETPRVLFLGVFRDLPAQVVVRAAPLELLTKVAQIRFDENVICSFWPAANGLPVHVRAQQRKEPHLGRLADGLDLEDDTPEAHEERVAVCRAVAVYVQDILVQALAIHFNKLGLGEPNVPRPSEAHRLSNELLVAHVKAGDPRVEKLDPVAVALFAVPFFAQLGHCDALVRLWSGPAAGGRTAKKRGVHLGLPRLVKLLKVLLQVQVARLAQAARAIVRNERRREHLANR
mmetsp:Transcript_3944/g.12446  ORF Transcript_3944/g.12446 Transcript_3944/m.12446 type:complete len:280 (+) Transcript_3944:905-1744(+)